MTISLKSLAAIAVVAMPVAAPAERPTACAISAYVTDNDPVGTNIRAAPSATAASVGRIPGGADAVVDITGMAGGWFRIAKVEQVGDDNRTLFSGTGWVHRSMVGIDVAFEDQRLYALPRSGSRVVARLRAGDDSVVLLGCRGGWAQVRFGKRIGWLSPGGQCSSPLTTCS